MILQVGPQVKQRHSNFTGRSYSIFSKVRLTCKLIALQTWSIKGFFAMSLNTKLFVTKCLGLSRTGSFGMTYIQAWIEIVHFWCWRIMVARKEGLLIFFFTCLDTDRHLIINWGCWNKCFLLGRGSLKKIHSNTAHVSVLWHDLHRLSERTTPRMIKERAARLAGKLMQDPR